MVHWPLPEYDSLPPPLTAWCLLCIKQLIIFRFGATESRTLTIIRRK